MTSNTQPTVRGPQTLSWGSAVGGKATQWYFMTQGTYGVRNFVSLKIKSMFWIVLKI